MDGKSSFVRWLFPAMAGIIVGVLVMVISGIIADSGKKPTVTLPDIKVYIKGEINSPGLYAVKADMRLCELIEKAGGATGNADIDRLNLAAYLTDGTTVTIPAVGSKETEPTDENTGIYISAGSDSPAETPDKITSGTININTAGVEQLMTLPGVGESTAEKIVAYRNENGDFLAIEEIMNVSGIGEKKFESMKPFLAVE